MSEGEGMIKPVLDACCAGRMFWFNKADPRAIYSDIRKGERIVDIGTKHTRGRKPLVVSPDVIADFRSMPFDDDSFYHVVFDPPHLTNIGLTGKFGFSYGALSKESWTKDLELGFAECFRVLKPYGTLVFKWCETEITISEVLRLTPEKPLYGHKSGKYGKTHWVAFIKDGKPSKKE